MASTTTETPNKLAYLNFWDDVNETLLTPVTKIGVLTAFGLMAIARITSMVLLLEFFTNFGGDLPGEIHTMLIMSLIDVIAVLGFVGFLAMPALFNATMKDWVRITLLSVAMLVLAASNALAAMGLGNLSF